METNGSAGVNPGVGKRNLWLIVGGVVLACCCLTAVAAALAWPVITQSVSSAVEGGSFYSGRADELLKRDTLSLIEGYESSTFGCSDVTLFMGQVIVAPEQSGDGSWIEMWQVTGCGASHLYSVTFTPSPAGGTDISVSPVEE